MYSIFYINAFKVKGRTLWICPGVTHEPPRNHCSGSIARARTESNAPRDESTGSLFAQDLQQHFEVRSFGQSHAKRMRLII